ncbi:MAG: uncharacterized protein C75L2_00340009 [Leptospirillum sp. Group II 'C75']|jgi:hypothetical protein|uniref:hypothetical protein n=1 Tax=Leptospirillum sp. Group II 'CF-1' TaxID=1660083 RepID=UPI0000F0CAC6|nr:hypothetical protein [Leptospirillum sp. Group II 'CF-1']AKS24097.1 hypothetical protein ABH19_10640 [Leptospirillum sp. Group II 'CF-1']EAY56421.1 MAG: conserved protein of unknown function [Leptospirillum rubarum]EIJ75066.1 MAG: uncharacterized protein C75L2_00340009 [Leptospirillum sp. Group II 'C75']
MDVEKVFGNVTGRKMSSDEVTRYLKFQKEFEIPDTDPTWLIFIWFEFYQRIFEKFPENAKTEIEKVISQLRSASVAVTAATSSEVKASREKANLEIAKATEQAKANVAAALSGTLETEIRNAVSRLQSQSNRPLHKKWLIVLGGLVLLAFGLGGWGLWSFYTYAENVGEAKMASAFGSPDFYHLMKCDLPGWKTRWTMLGKEKHLACYPYPDKDGSINGWRIR